MVSHMPLLVDSLAYLYIYVSDLGCLGTRGYRPENPGLEVGYSCGQLKSTNWISREPDFLVKIWRQIWNRTGKRSSKMVFSCYSHAFWPRQNFEQNFRFTSSPQIAKFRDLSFGNSSNPPATLVTGFMMASWPSDWLFSVRKRPIQ